VDKDGFISRRIEKLKMRLNRRLIKLAKWADTPVEERQQLSETGQLRPAIAEAVVDLNQGRNFRNPLQNRRGVGRPPTVNRNADQPGAFKSYTPRPQVAMATNSFAAAAMQHSAIGRPPPQSFHSGGKPMLQGQGVPQRLSSLPAPLPPQTSNSSVEEKLSAMIALQRQVVTDANKSFFGGPLGNLNNMNFPASLSQPLAPSHMHQQQQQQQQQQYQQQQYQQQQQFQQQLYQHQHHQQQQLLHHQQQLRQPAPTFQSLVLGQNATNSSINQNFGTGQFPHHSMTNNPPAPYAPADPQSSSSRVINPK